jgi:hypothetical protein
MTAKVGLGAPGFGDGKLVPFTDSLWTATTPIRFAGTWFPHVMTVVRLAGDNLLLHSPCRLSALLADELARLGKVSHIVAPNFFHDLYLREYRDRYPYATFWGPSFLRLQHPRIIDHALNGDVEPLWLPQLPYYAVGGLLTCGDFLFFHVATRTLIVVDLLINASAGPNAPLGTRLGYRFLGLDGRLQVFPITRWFALASRGQLQRAARQVAEWKPERLIVGHGPPIARGANDQLVAAFRWVKAS